MEKKFRQQWDVTRLNVKSIKLLLTHKNAKFIEMQIFPEKKNFRKKS